MQKSEEALRMALVQIAEWAAEHVGGCTCIDETPFEKLAPAEMAALSLMGAILGGNAAARFGGISTDRVKVG